MSDLASIGAVAGQARSTEELARLIDPRKMPTAEQQVIIGAGLEPTLVVAGAGSGKTETLSMRMVYLLDHAERLFGTTITPDQILCLTFTRKAASEIAARSEERIQKVFGTDAERPAPTVATYNGYAAAIVAEHGLRVGVDPDSTVITNAALWQMATALVEDWTATIESDSAVSTVISAVPALSQQLREHEHTPGDLRAWATQALVFMEDLPRKAGDEVPGVMTKALGGQVGKLRTLIALADLVESFQQRKEDRSFLDFSDQIAIAGHVSRLPAVQAIERSRYRVVLLDEFQDTSPAQLQLFARMFGTQHSVMAVGDPNQAIYGFRGASASALSSFVTQFGGPDAVTETSLSVSWRNEASVLAVANAVAAPLRARASVHVDPLRSQGEELNIAEPHREAPGVVAHMFPDLAEEAAGVVDFIRDRRSELAAASDGDDPITAAVLCRRRVQFTAIVDALEHAGMEYEVVGLGGLLDTAEVADLVALLEVAHDPSRGDSLMRLLTSERVAVGIRDLAALREWSAHLAGPRRTRESEPSLVDAIASLPPEDWESPEHRTLSATARERLAELQRVTALIRSHTYLPLSELVLFAERAWGLDIEAAVARPDGRAARNMDAFVDAVHSFAAGAEHATLGALLAWLDAAREQESGLDAPVKEFEPGAVQLLTVHASKGLEWDVVAIPGLDDGQFPSVTVPSASNPKYRDSAWLRGIGNLPWELRMDRNDLPQWRWRSSIDHKSLTASLEKFFEDSGEHTLDEERRLFYVAITRARSYVLASGSWWSNGKTVREPSCYLTELVEHGHLSKAHWAARPEPGMVPPETSAAPQMWPPPLTPAQQQRREVAAEVHQIGSDDDHEGNPWDDSLPLAREVRAMLAERSWRDRRQGHVVTPSHLSTSALVSLQRDRAAFIAQLRRPLPVEPTIAAQHGSALHAWIEQEFRRHSLLDGPASLADEGFAPEDDHAAALDTLKATFEASEWAQRLPSDIEVDVEIPVGGTTVRSRIDAVFPPGNGLDRVTVVDWKSGRPPRDPHEQAAREVQLAVYRLAWSQWKGLALEDVDAAFYYVAADATVRPATLLDRDQIVALIRGTESAKP